MAAINVLILGSGMVALPCVEYLLREPRNRITIACRTLSTAQTLASGLPRTTPISLDVTSAAELESKIASHDLVVSLVPYTYHASIIKLAIDRKTNVVTTSYVSDAMKELDTPAKETGIVVLNEVGVDPGVDHLYAIKKIGEVHGQGGKVKEFYSYCGGLPARKCLRSISEPDLDGSAPQELITTPSRTRKQPTWLQILLVSSGALLSQVNSACFLSDNKKVEISNKDLMDVARPCFVLDGYNLVAYPNRNSLPFQDFYAFVEALMNLGWLDPEPKDWLQAELTWTEVLQKVIGAHDSNEDVLVSRVKELCKFPTDAESHRILDGLHWIGFFSSEQATVRAGNLLDILCAKLEKKLSYQPGERDLVILQHRFVVQWQDGQEVINPNLIVSMALITSTSTLELYGDPNGFSAMAKSVGLTCGIATQLLLNGHRALNTPDVLAPYTEDICDPIRELLEKEGIRMVEKLV